MRPAVILLALLSLWSAADAIERPASRDLLVAAAASLSGIAPDLARAFREASGIAVRFNFGGSNTLARQIVEGARVDAFVSADAAQMDVVERAGRVVAGTRVDVVGNRLVVITSDPRRAAVRPDDLAAPAVQRLAMGDPAAVPAGVYGRQWLEALGLWPAVEPKVVPLASSPAVVAAVRARRADLGIVYGSDVQGRPDVRVAYTVPIADAPRIVYPAAVVTGGRLATAQRFTEFLRSASAQRIFQSAGFLPLTSR